MGFKIEQAESGGWAAYRVTGGCAEEPKLQAVGHSLGEVCDQIARPARQQYPLIAWARHIVDCDPDSDSPRKISMIKLLREITGCGLKEAKDAIEEALG